MEANDTYYMTLVVILLIYTIFLTIKESGHKRERGKLELQRSALIEKLRGLGVLVFLSERSFTGLDYRCTKDARELEEAHFYGSAWNLERQIDYEQSQRDLLALKKDMGTLEVTGEPVEDLEKAILKVRVTAEELNEKAKAVRESLEEGAAFLDEEWEQETPDQIKEDNLDRQVRLEEDRLQRSRASRPHEGGPYPFTPPDLI